MSDSIQQMAVNMAHAWRGTDPMRSADDVRRAVEATGDVRAEGVDAVVEALLPLLRRDGTLVEDVSAELVVVKLAGGDASRSDAAICVDLESAVHGRWSALVRRDRVAELLEQTDAELCGDPEAWDGERFGDGAGTVWRDASGAVRGNGLYAPGLEAA